MDSQSPSDASSNSLYADILEDIKSRSKWYELDSEICKRRLSERKRKKKKPYVGAPNGVVPIIDDVTSEKTDQEITMILNAPLLAHFIPLAEADPIIVAKAARGFDTYLRHVCKIRPKADCADDTKNARGFAVMKVIRKEDERWGTIPDVEYVDPKDLIVPFNTMRLQDADRICEVLRLSPREVRRRGRENGWKNVEEIIAKCAGRGESSKNGGDSPERSLLEETAHLIGLTTNGKNKDEVVIWVVWHYATKEDAAKDPTGDTIEGRRCCKIFSPDAPELIAKYFPWREMDEDKPLDANEQLTEITKAAQEARAPVLTKRVIGKDKPFPYIQARAESRSPYYYDCRGVGHRCMDDQIYATGLFNAKMTMIDYISQPMFESDEVQNSGNFSAEPGAILPKGLKFAQPPQPPQQLDFSIDYHKRVASQRSGSASSIYSANVDESRKLQKSATEVQDQSARLGTMSSASVDRFNDPWRELYEMVWADLKRLGKPLPIIQNNEFGGMTEAAIYDIPFLIVPAASAKTLNPDIQFGRAQQAMSFAAGFKDLGVPQDFAKAMRWTLSHFDPYFADQLLIDPKAVGPEGQPPIEQQLQGMQAAIQHLAELIDSRSKDLEDVQKLSIKHDDQLKQKEAGGEIPAQAAVQ